MSTTNSTSSGSRVLLALSAEPEVLSKPRKGVRRTRLLPYLSSASAASSTVSRAAASSTLQRAKSAAKEPCWAMGFPKATLCRALRPISSMARSPMPIRRMQWCSLPGPSLP